MAIGRPALAVGTYGAISLTEVTPSKYRARARYRDRDGEVRTVVRFGQTKTAATNALKAALVDRQHGAADGIRSTTTVRDLGKLWLVGVQSSNKAARTKETYRQAVERYVNAEMGGLRVQEATTGVCDGVLTRITASRGPGAAKAAKSVLRGMFKLAVQHGALTVNPIRETSPIPRNRSLSRSLTPEQVQGLTDWLRTDERAVMFDLPDLIDFGLSTGCRIGEVMAIREAALDLDAGTVEINATAVRIPKVGMVVQERPKTAAGWRVLALPPSAVDMLRRRQSELRVRTADITVLDADGKMRTEAMWMAFPSPLAGTVRDASNTSASIREALEQYKKATEQDLTWVSFHTFRKTVATMLDAAGFTGREIADQLGHSQPSMTQDRYMGRKVVSSRSADVLGR